MYFGNELFEHEDSSKKEQLEADILDEGQLKPLTDPLSEIEIPERKSTKKSKSKSRAKPKATEPKKEIVSLKSDTNAPRCDPYSQFGFYDFQSPLQYNITYNSLNPSCQPLNPSPVSALENGLPFEQLQDKTAVLIGDSIDRQNLELLCPYIKGELFISDQDSHDKPAPGSSGGYPRRCYVEKYNLSISNYFFYGFDRDSIWPDKANVFLEPGDYLKRLDLMQSALASLNRKVDVAFINVGFWELARFDRLDSNENLPEAISLRSTSVEEYQTKLTDFVEKVFALLPHSRIIYRETHYPHYESGPFFSTASTVNRKHKFHRYKVNQLNQVVQYLVKKLPELEYWPIGTLVRDIPDGEYMLDDSKYLHHNH